MSSIQIDTEVITRLQQALPVIADDLVIGLGEAVRAEIAVGWSAESPSSPGEAPAIVTGSLAGSIQLIPLGEGSAQIGSHAEHAAPLEWGTAHMAARPWLRPAVERVKQQIAARVREQITAWMR